MRLRRSRGIFAAVALAALLGVLAVLFRPNPVVVEAAIASRGPMKVTVSSEGRTKAKDQFEVVAPIAGRLLRISLKAGDSVVEGRTIIAVIEPPQPQFNDSRSNAELEAKVKAAEAALGHALADQDRAKADLEFAKQEIDRNRSLSSIGAVSNRVLQQAERDIKTREAALMVAESVVKQRTSELELAKASLTNPSPGPSEASDPPPSLEIRAPVTGKVLNVIKESEAIVTPGMPLVQLGDVTKLEVMLEMLSEDAVKVRPGSSAVLEGWGGTQLNARVRRIEPSGFTKVSALGIEEQRVRVMLDFTDPPEKWETLGHGYRVNAKITIWNGDNVLKVPLGSLFRDENTWACYAIVGGQAQLKHLEIGHINDAEAEVLAGLADGAAVILHPSDRITNAVPVVMRN